MCYTAPFHSHCTVDDTRCLQREMLHSAGYLCALQVLLQDCYFTSAQAGQIVAALSYGADKVEAAVKVRLLLRDLTRRTTGSPETWSAFNVVTQQGSGVVADNSVH